MRLIILNQFFYPDHSATSQLMTVLAEDLTAAGVKVTAMASRGSYNGGASYESAETYKGINIKRVWATSFGKHKLWRRLFDYATFYLGAIWALLTMPRQDVVMALTTPPLIGLVALSVARFRNMRFVSLQEDIYPDVGIALGFIPAKGLIPRILDKLSCLVIRQADRVIVLSDCMLRHVLSKFSPAVADELIQKIDIIHNWADGAEVKPLAGTKQQFFSARGLSDLADKFIVLFTGNLGLVNDFSAVLQAAENLKDEQELAFVFIGAGARVNEIQTAIESKGLTNLHLLPYQSRKQMPFALGAADALLITLRDGLAGMSVPSKTYTSLAAGRPLLYVGDQRASVVRIIEQGDCGFACGPNEGVQLELILRKWVKNRDSVKFAGERARHLFEEYFDRPKAVSAYVNSLRRSLSQTSLDKVSVLTSDKIDSPIAVPIPSLASKAAPRVKKSAISPAAPDTSISDAYEKTA